MLSINLIIWRSVDYVFYLHFKLQPNFFFFFFFLAEGVVTTLSGTNLKWLIVSGQGVPEKSGCKEEIVLSSP